MPPIDAALAHVQPQASSTLESIREAIAARP